MAGIDTLLDFDSPVVTSSTHVETNISSFATNSSTAAKDPFDFDSFGHFESESSAREGEPDLIFDSFDLFAPSALSSGADTSSKMETLEVTTTTERQVVNGKPSFDDQFSELLGDFGPDNSTLSGQGYTGDSERDDERDFDERHGNSHEGNGVDRYENEEEQQETGYNAQEKFNGDVQENDEFVVEETTEDEHQHSNTYQNGNGRTEYDEYNEYVEEEPVQYHEDDDGEFQQHGEDFQQSDRFSPEPQHSDVDDFEDRQQQQQQQQWQQQETEFEEPQVHKEPTVVHTTSTITKPHYQQVQQQQQQQQPPPPPQQLHRRLQNDRPISDDTTCRQCGKRVYEMEKITADEILYHKSCFRCTHCNRVLNLQNYSVLDGQMFCKPHFLEIFKMRGKYEVGVVPAKPDINNYTIDGDDDARPRNGSASGRSASPGRDRSCGSDDDESVVRPSHDFMEEIPQIPLKHVRNIFENLAQNSSAQQQQVQMQPKRNSKWDKPPAAAAPAAVVDTVDLVDVKLRANVQHSAAPLERRRSSSTRDEDDGGHEVVQGSSTVYVLEDELPPPAFTRGILAKFRELESGGSGIPSPGKSSPSPVNGSSSARKVSASKAEDVRNAPPEREKEVRGILRSKRVESPEDQRRGGDFLDGPERRSATSGSERSSRRSDYYSEQMERNSTERESDDYKTSPASDELPQQGTARSLLARWRTIEQQASHGRDEAPKRQSMSRRSQSTSRIEGRQRLARPPISDDEDERVADYLDVQQKPDVYDVNGDDERVPQLKTKQVLAKFRNMEAENKVASSRQVPLQRQREEIVVVEKSFKWEVKEAVPLSRGNLVVHGDVPRRSVVDGDRVVSPEDPSDGSGLHEDELPAPATTRSLLSMFKSLEDPSKAPPTPERAEKTAKSSVSSGKRPSIGDDSDVYERTNSNRSYDYTPEAGEFENEPVYNESVVRESDHTDEAELPERGTTRGLLAKFQQLQSRQ